MTSLRDQHSRHIDGRYVIGKQSHEELQSTNEELATSKEEIQSTNEELSSLNEELNNRNLELFRLNQSLQRESEFSTSIVASIRGPLLVLDATFRVKMASPAFYRDFGVTPADTEGEFVYNLGNRQWDIPALRTLLEQLLPRDQRIINYEVRHAFQQIGSSIILVNAEMLARHAGQDALIVLAFEDITERKQAEEAFHRVAFDEAPTGMVFLGLDGSFTKANESICGVTGYSADELTCMKFSHLSHVDDRARDAAQFGQFLRGSMPTYKIETRLVRKDGGIRWVTVTARMLTDSEAHPLRIIAVIQDITERKAADAQLRESELRFRMMLEALPQLAWSARADGFIHWYNQRWYDYTGTTPKDMEGWGWQSVHAPATLPSVLERWKSSIASGSPFEMVFPLRGSDGRFRNFLTRVLALKDADGRVTQWFGTNTDVEELKEAEKALQSSEMRLRQSLDAAEQGTFYYDAKTDQVTWDDRTRQLFNADHKQDGFPVSEMIDCVHPDDRPAVRLEVAKALDPNGDGTYKIEHRINMTDGSLRWVAVHGHTVFADRSAVRVPIYAHGTVRDITARKSAQDQIKLLMREVNHRAKNMLGVVQAIARHTAKSSPNDFIARFSDRVGALAANQDLLVNSNWHGADLAMLVRAQLAHFNELFDSRIIFNGEAIQLSAATAQAIGMALHELSTNAVKYGALSNANGCVTIAWRLTTSEDSTRRFEMTWIERGGPSVVAPSRRGFGTTVIDAMAKNGLGANVRVDFSPDGFEWHLDCPAERLGDERS